MKPINPEWYEALKGEPLRERTFTDALAASIQERAARPPVRGTASRRLAAAGLTAALAAASAICYDGLLDTSDRAGHDAAPVQAASADLIVGSSFQPLPYDDNRITVRFSQSITDDHLPAVEAPHNALLERQTEDRAKFEFWTVRKEDGSYVFGADYYVKENDAQDWQPRGTATFTEQADESSLSKGGLISHSLGYDDYTVFAGQVLDPNAETVRLTDRKGNRTEATIVRNADGRFWVAVVYGRPDGYTLQALDRDGEPLGSPVR